MGNLEFYPAALEDLARWAERDRELALRVRSPWLGRVAVNGIFDWQE